MARFKIGDEVVLKSGGPVMTIDGFVSDGETARAQWFVGTDLKVGMFAVESLRPYVKDEESLPTPQYD